MWDCMETVWKAAVEDPECDVYVVPIPYFDIKADKTAGDMHYVLRNAAVMLGITGVGAICAILRNILSSRVSQSVARDLRRDLYRKIQSFSSENIDRFERASLITRLTNDVTQIQHLVNGMMRFFVRAPLLCIGAIFMMLSLNPKMAAVLLVVIPVIALIVFLSMRIGFPYFVRVQKVLDRMATVMREYLSGVRVVKAFGRFDYEQQRFDTVNEELSTTTRSSLRVMSVFSPAISLTVNLGVVAVLWMGGYRVASGSAQVGEIMAFVNYMLQVAHAFYVISNIFNTLVRAKASGDRIGAVFAAENTLPEAPEPVALTSLQEGITFDNVSFRYAGAGADALRNISFTAGVGETIGIIGPTGAGKSSLINLLPRFYDVTQGAIRFDGVDLRDMDIEALRRLIALVPQKSVLFTGEIGENLLWGDPNASDEEIFAAAEAAQAAEFIDRFPEGYATMLGQGGVNLSGGQKQRLSIARALLKKPAVLILDDCTSAVDVATEAKIRAALSRYCRGDLITFIISQRITSVMRADRILVLDDGELVGAATHDELMMHCEVYRDIYRSQLGEGDENLG